MLNLLIADDEYLVLESLKMIISKNFKDINIVATASSGREAIEKAVSFKPDIVFMDIHMPGIDGIEAIRQIKSVNSDTLFVILTAYEYFDYAKEALNLGVFEYLLKPINKNKLIETISNINIAINKKRGTMIRELELKERMSKIIPSLEAQFISNKLFNTGILNDMDFYENIFGINIKQGYAMTVLLGGSDGKGKEESLKLNAQKQSFYDTFNIKIKSLCQCLVGMPVSDRIIVYIPTDSRTEADIIKNKALEIGKRVIEKIKGMSNLAYQVGIGRRYDIENFSKSCNEAYIAATKAKERDFMHFEQISMNNSSFNTYPLHRETAFSNSILTANVKEAKEAFEDIYIWLTSFYGNDIDRIKSKFIDLFFIVEKMLPYKLEELDELKQKYVLNILKISSKDELRIQFLNYLSELAIEIQNQKKGDIDGIIPTVLEYLNNNYYCDISLNDVAKSVNLSYHYLSKIFKDEVGKSFTDYLTELRLEKSMKLLANQNISVKEICQKIGYNDPNYYSKAFKKITGMTPTEYRLFISMGSDGIDQR